MITPQDWNAVDRQTYTPKQQQAIDSYITANGEHYNRVIDALQDYAAAQTLDGSNRAAVRLLTGLTDAELSDLGGFANDPDQ
jgi:hypothetical protein